MKQAEIEKLNVSKKFGVNSNASIINCPLHWHTFYEVEFAIAGTSIQKVNGYIYQQEPGFLSIMTPNDFHSINSIDGSFIKYKKFIFSEDFISPDIISILKSRKKPCIIQVPPHKQPDFHRYFDLINEYTNNMEQNQITIITIKKLAETVCAEAFLLDSTAGANSSVLPIFERDADLHKITKYVDENFHTSIKIRDVAKIVCQSESSFSHYFKNKFGLSFSEYLKNYRLKFATTLLISTGKSIAEICELSGFSSITFFNRAFKDFYNLTPSQFRKQARMKQ